MSRQTSSSFVLLIFILFFGCATSGPIKTYTGPDVTRDKLAVVGTIAPCFISELDGVSYENSDLASVYQLLPGGHEIFLVYYDLENDPFSNRKIEWRWDGKIPVRVKEGHAYYFFCDVSLDKNSARVVNSSLEDINAVDENGRTSMMKASIYQKEYAYAIMKFLVENGVDPNKRDKDGRTALMYIGNFSNPYSLNAVKLLIDHGADINAKDKSGKSVLTYASENSNPDVVNLLKERGAK
ncbi:MAG: ankyrin repeat domain-containing protein [Nitrospiraceae bacterium]|nr:ankyrin repeat domain-containing protein [Nitrospiraceae bacterium]